jgi:hypothetical protein
MVLLSLDVHSGEVFLPCMEWWMLNSIHTENDERLHFSAISLLLSVYVTEGEHTSIESPDTQSGGYASMRTGWPNGRKRNCFSNPAAANACSI